MDHSQFLFKVSVVHRDPGPQPHVRALGPHYLLVSTYERCSVIWEASLMITAVIVKVGF